MSIMMLQRIEEHLERMQRIEEMGLTDLSPDLRGHQRTLLTAYQQAEASGAKNREALEQELDDWLAGGLEQLVETLHWMLLAEFGAELSADERKQLIDWAVLASSIHGLDEFAVAPNRTAPNRTAPNRTAPNRTMQVWIDHAMVNHLDVYASWLRGDSELFAWEIIPRYCERVGLVSRGSGRARVEVPGHTWLRLRGVDRLRWLLALECANATHDRDEWCISRAELAAILRHAGQTLQMMLTVQAWDASSRPKTSGFHRWTALGALTLSWGENQLSCRYDLSPTGRQLFDPANAEILELFHGLARAQGQDERGRALDPSEERSELAATTMRHARLVAHEVRNALLPVSHALNKVWKALDDTSLERELRQPREQIEHGITRLYEFVEASARMSASVDELPATFVVLEAIEEARRTLVELSGSVRVATLPGTANPRCRGHRGRFVLALLNLMRNAIQAGGPTVELSITVDATSPERIEITIADDGPGVPEAMRERLFENGTSSRASGTGHGLALVREVVERELRGHISYEASESGARFRLGLPSLQESSP